MNIVTKSLVIRLYPSSLELNLINQNLGNVRFVWNNLLSEYNYIRKLLLDKGYGNIQCNWKTFNTLLNMLKVEHPFLKMSNASTLQQVFRDLVHAFDNFFKNKYGYPKLKSKRNYNQSFMIQQKHGNTIRISNNRIRLPKIGFVKFRTSKKYMGLLKSSKINHVRIKFENGKYYAVVNVETSHKPSCPNNNESIGIDLGIYTLATCSNGLKIANLDPTYEKAMMRKYVKQMERRKKGSRRYLKARNSYWKWSDRKKNKLKDAYHKFTSHLINNYNLIALEDLNIRAMSRHNKISSSIHDIALGRIVTQLSYKSEWNNNSFVQISRWFPSSQLCNVCGYQYSKLRWGEEEWICPECNTCHDRDLNASINIKNEGLRIHKNNNS